MDQTEIEHVPVDSVPLPNWADGASDVKNINETYLAENFANGAVKSIVVDESDQGFSISVTFTWRKDGPFRLSTYRGKATRYWRSADRLFNYLKQFDHVPPIVVRLSPKGPEPAGDQLPP